MYSNFVPLSFAKIRFEDQVSYAKSEFRQSSKVVLNFLTANFRVKHKQKQENNEANSYLIKSRPCMTVDFIKF